MTQQKDLKRLVRSRMQKTGESYTTARAHLLSRKNGAKKTPSEKVAAAVPESAAKPEKSAKPRKAAAAPHAIDLSKPPVSEYAAIAGMSDAAVAKATGCRWEKWVKSLDHARAYGWAHPEIAAHIREKYGIDGWWSQMVAVSYERIRGLREKGQRRDGTHEISKSKTVPMPIATLYAAFATAAARRKWLGDAPVTVKKATPEKSMRFQWEDDTPFEVNFWVKGAAKSAPKSQVQLQHRGFRTKADAERMRKFWSERLDALAESLAKA